MSIFSRLKDSIVKKYAGSLIRHALTVACGVLVAKGLLSADEAAHLAEILSGVGVGLLGIGLSVVEKHS